MHGGCQGKTTSSPSWVIYTISMIRDLGKFNPGVNTVSNVWKAFTLSTDLPICLWTISLLKKTLYSLLIPLGLVLAINSP